MPVDVSRLAQLARQVPDHQRTEGQRSDVAQTYADVAIDPQKQALERALAQAVTDATAQEERISAAYAGAPERLDRMASKQRERDMASAIARGVGRGGVVEHQAAARDEHFGELAAQQEASQAAELTNIANQLAHTQREGGERLVDLEGQRGNLVQQHLAQLEDQDYQRGMRGWEAQFGAAQQLVAAEQTNVQLQEQQEARAFQESRLDSLDQQEQNRYEWRRQRGMLPEQISAAQLDLSERQFDAGRRQFAQQHGLARKQFGLQRDQFGLQQDQFGESKRQWQKSFDEGVRQHDDASARQWTNIMGHTPGRLSGITTTATQTQQPSGLPRETTYFPVDPHTGKQAKPKHHYW